MVDVDPGILVLLAGCLGQVNPQVSFVDQPPVFVKLIRVQGEEVDVPEVKGNPGTGGKFQIKSCTRDGEKAGKFTISNTFGIKYLKGQLLA